MTFPTITINAAFDDGPFDVPTYDVDLSDRLTRVQWTLGRTRDLSDWLPSGFTLEFDNSDRELDPEYTSGTYYGSLLPRVPVRVQVTHDATTYNLLHGFAGEDGWEQTYQPPAVSECRVRCTDLLGVLAGRSLPTVLEYEILQDSPVAFWPLDETAGIEMADRSGNGRDGEYEVGTTQLSTTAGLGASEIRGIQFDGEHLAIAGVDSAVSERPCTIEVVGLMDDLGSGTVVVAVRTGTGNPNGGAILAMEHHPTQIDISGGFRSYTNGYAFGNTTTINRPSHVAYRIGASGAAAVYADGVDVTTSTVTATDGVVAPAATIVGATKSNQGSFRFQGFLASVALYDTDIGSSRISAHAEAALSPWDGQTTGERIEAVLEDLVGFPSSLLDLGQGLSVLGPASTGGRDALEYVTACARTEQGILTVRHDDAGQINFIDRTAILTETRHTTSQATFTDKDGSLSAGEYRYEPNLVVEPASINTVINQVTVNYIGGSVTVKDDTSIAAYGPRGQSFDTLHDTPAEARSFGEYVLGRYKDPITRVRELTLDCATCPESLDAALTLRVGDRVTVERKPQNLGNTISDEYLIEGISGEIANGVNIFRVTYYLSPADTKVYGLWGSGNWDSALWAY